MGQTKYFKYTYEVYIYYIGMYIYIYTHKYVQYTRENGHKRKKKNARHIAIQRAQKRHELNGY